MRERHTEPRFSVVIPTLNEAEAIGPTLDAVEAALTPSLEIIVVDGGSRDGTRALVEGRATLISTAPGRGSQLNAGAAAARGDIFIFLHADTLLPRDAAGAISTAIYRVGATGGCFALRIHGPSAARPIALLLGRAISMRSRLFRTATGDQAIFVRRRAFERSGGFPDVELFEDVLFYRELRRLGKVTVIRSPALTSDRRWRRFGYVRTILSHLGLRFLMLIGVPPAELARRYIGAR